MAFIKIKDKLNREFIINTNQIIKIYKVNVYYAIILSESSIYCCYEEIEKVFTAIGVSLK